MRRRKRTDEPNLFALRCGACDRQLVPTESGYLACPLGHGRLIPDELPGTADSERCGSLFDSDPEEEGW